MEIIKNNRKAIGVIAGATLAAGLYLLVKKALKEDTPIDVDLSQVVPKSLTDEEKRAIVEGIRVQYDGINLTMATISEIIEATIKIITPEFSLLTWKDRKERRANKEDLKTYVELAERYTKAVDKLISETQMSILDYLEVPDSIWENSNSYYMSQGSQDLMLLHASIHSRVNMKSSKFLLKDEFLSVLTRQIDLLEEEGHNIRKISALTSHPRKIMGVIHMRVNDCLAEEFGVEDEDFMNAMKRYKSTPEFEPLFNRLQKVTRSLGPGGNRGGPKPKRR